MKIYRTETRKDYDALMYELESKGVKWYSGKQPHEFDGFEEYESETVISVTNELIEYFCMDFYKENYNEVEIVEYKAGKEFKNLNESILEIIENLAQATNLKSFYSLQKAKQNLDRLIEKWEVENDTKI